MSSWDGVFADLKYRFGALPSGHHAAAAQLAERGPPDLWTRLAGRGSVRAFAEPAPSIAELRLIAAVALAAPTKSDLQQCDLILVDDPAQVDALKEVCHEPWAMGAPVLVVFCGDNRRQRLVHEMRGHPFVNDHLDAFFNATVDAAIVLASFVFVAESVGFGTCPISAIRNRAEAASSILNLPQHVFPVAGLAIGRPAQAPEISPRLPLELTVHHNAYTAADDGAIINEYDARRAKLQPFARQRFVADYGEAESYVWSEDKSRQYSKPERAEYGAFIRKKGFRLD